MEKKTSVFENGLIWFGAGVSIAEIITGTLFAPLGFSKGLLAIFIGHIIGCAMLFFAGYIGGKTGKTSMETVSRSFGNKGSMLFSIINIVQLVGWTAIMIFDGSLAANEAMDIGTWAWCLVIGGLVLLWIIIGIKNLGKINTISMLALTILTIILSTVVFKDVSIQNGTSEALTFGSAVELSVAMPLSWLPLISDYTSTAKKPTQATIVSVVCYGLVSCWMYIIGMGAAIFTGTSDIAKIMVKAGLGIAALIIIILSTVTTTFLDVYSTGVSSEAITKKINGKWVCVLAVIIGTIFAIFVPLNDITEFLYFISSVFAPMVAIQIADFYILKKDISYKKFDWVNLIIWLVGFISYRLLMRVDIIIGNTLPDMLITIALCVIIHFIVKAITKNKKSKSTKESEQTAVLCSNTTDENNIANNQNVIDKNSVTTVANIDTTTKTDIEILDAASTDSTTKNSNTCYAKTIDLQVNEQTEFYNKKDND